MPFPLHHVRPNVITTCVQPDGITTFATPYRIEETDKTLPKLIKALGGQDAFEALPVLDLGACTAKGGDTGYIDFVRSDDMTAPIMRGEDEHGRPFVAFRIKTERRAEAVETLFRRYTKGNVWTSGGSNALCCNAVDEEVLTKVKTLTLTGRVDYTDWAERNRSIALVMS